MKVSEIKQLIENIVTDEVRKTIMEEATGKKEVYHIKCEGIPLATFATEEEANEALPDYKDKHKDGELIIEKGTYNSDEDMLNKLDEMNDQLEETEDMDNTQEPNEGNAFSGALADAKAHHKDKFEVGGKQFNVKEEDSMDYGDEDTSPEPRIDHMSREEMVEFLNLSPEDAELFSDEELQSLVSEKNDDMVDEEEECHECGSGYMEEEEDEFEKLLRGKKNNNNMGGGEEMTDELGEEKECCSECGKEVCECGGGMYESKKKTIRLTESELTKLIAKMVNESVPGLEAAKKAHTESGKENKSALNDVEKKISKALSFDGNDNPEFPKAIGKGEKVARKNTPAQEDEIKKNFAGLENLDYDIEPDEKFKKRLKMAIEGDTTMGNAPTTEKTDVKPSNGAKLGEEPKDKDGNVIPTPETAKGIEKQVKDRQKDKDNRELYNKQPIPVTSKKSINEEVEKMKKMFTYNKKTQ